MRNESGASAGNKAIKIVAALVLVMIFVTFGRLVISYINGDTLTIETGGCHPDAATTGIMDAATKAWLNSGCNETAPVEEEPIETRSSTTDTDFWTWLGGQMQGEAPDEEEQSNGELEQEESTPSEK